MFMRFTLLCAAILLAQVSLQPIESQQLHNVWQLSPRIISGSEPENEAAFAELARLGVKTILSVDGIAPRVDLAKKYGLRYIHVPIGYDGIDERAQQSLARVAKEVEGSIYIHCHHGKHRGPAAAAIVCRADDGRSSDSARAILEKAGTGKEYPGLWRDVATFIRPSDQVKLPELVERAEVESLAAAMARIDRVFDRLKLFSQAKWQQLHDHPDVVASQEAVQLLELFTEAARQTRPAELQAALQSAARSASELRIAIDKQDHAQADKLLRAFSSSCTACHQSFRN